MSYFDSDYGKTLCGLDCYNSGILNENLRLEGESKNDVSCLKCISIHNSYLEQEKASSIVHDVFKKITKDIDFEEKSVNSKKYLNKSKNISNYMIKVFVTSKMTDLTIEQIEYWGNIQKKINKI